MTIFANKPVGSTKVTCKYCDNTSYLGEVGNYCSKCGKPLTDIPKKKKLTGRDFENLYNYYFNRDKDIFSDQSKRIFEFYLKNLYSNIEVDTIPMINSSLRSGYSIGLAEEKIYNKTISPLTNIKSILGKARTSIRGTDIEISTLDESDGNLLALAVYLVVDYRYETYCLDKNIIDDHLMSIIQSNIGYLTPALKKVYEGKTIMNTVAGIIPHVFNKPIKFDNDLKSRWNTYISDDTIFGYCVKLAESYLTDN